MKQKNAVLIIALCLLISIITPASAIETLTEKTLDKATAWVRASEEFKGLSQQAYDNAALRLPHLVKNQKPGTWCVVFDMDETLVTNVQYEAEQDAQGKPFSEESWTLWCNRAEAIPLPGAIEFCRLVRKLGGKVIIITNRKAPQKEGTLKNLDNIGLPHDACILQEGPYEKDRIKVERRKDVEAGTLKTLPPGVTLPKLNIIMLAGDQVHDLYDTSKYTFQDVKHRYAKDFIILPNPMYGDWIKRKEAKVTIQRLDSGEAVPVKVHTSQEQKLEQKTENNKKHPCSSCSGCSNKK